MPYLKDAVSGADGACRHDHRHHRSAAVAGEESDAHWNHEEKQQLLGVSKPLGRCRRKSSGEERRTGESGESPEKARHDDRLTPRDDQGEPAGDGHREQRLRRGNRKLKRDGHAKNCHEPDLLQPVDGAHGV